MTMPSEKSWCVVQTHANAEAKAAAHLARQGYEVYMPRYLKRRSHARRVDNVPAPLFPRYVFVAFEPQAARWQSIKSTLGVSHLICVGAEPAILAERVVGELRSRESLDGFIELNIPRLFMQGDKVRVIGGAFSESFGSFEKTTDRERVAILLDLLGRKVRVVLNEESIVAA